MQRLVYSSALVALVFVALPPRPVLAVDPVLASDLVPASDPAQGTELPPETAAAAKDWVATRRLAAPEAFQAAAADDRFVYAINNNSVVRYDRGTGNRLAASDGAAEHLNSGWLQAGKLYCAHSNYPQKPERSEIKVLDLDSMRLATFHDFGQSTDGSLTWALMHDDHWFCNFAHYDDQNHRTVLVKFTPDWREVARWHYPATVLRDLGKYSISGAVLRDGELLATGHDNRLLYRLRIPEAGETLIHVATVAAPFTGQGIAADPVSGGLVGIDRGQRQVIFASPAPDR
jgi:hypothetical protein